MSLSIVFHGDGDYGPFQLASASGWKLFAEWCTDGPLHEFVEGGEYKGTEELAQALRARLARNPPANDDVKYTALTLHGLLGVGSPDETVTVVE